MKSSKSIIAFVLAIAFCSTACAALSPPEIVIYDGKEFVMDYDYDVTGRAVWFAAAYPMEAYFEKHPDKHPLGTNPPPLHRDYIGTYEVKDGQLFLKDIEAKLRKGNGEFESVMEKMFPDKKPLKIDWLSGTLHLREQREGRKPFQLKIEKGNIIKNETPKSSETPENPETNP